MCTAILPFRTRFGTPWAVVWHLPGASAMRAIDRIQVVTGMVAILAIAAAASELSQLTSNWNRARIWQVAGLILLALAVGDQVNTSRTSYVNRITQVAFLDSLSSPWVASTSSWWTRLDACHDDYEESFLPTGVMGGSPEEALDCACGLYLGDPSAWISRL